MCLFLNSVDLNVMSVLHTGHRSTLSLVVFFFNDKNSTSLVLLVVAVALLSLLSLVSPLPLTIKASGSFCKTTANARDDACSSCSFLFMLLLLPPLPLPSKQLLTCVVFSCSFKCCNSHKHTGQAESTFSRPILSTAKALVRPR